MEVTYKNKIAEMFIQNLKLIWIHQMKIKTKKMQVMKRLLGKLSVLSNINLVKLLSTEETCLQKLKVSIAQICSTILPKTQ